MMKREHAVSPRVLCWMRTLAEVLKIVIARSKATKQSTLPFCCEMDCFASLAMTEDTLSHSRGTMRPRFASIFAPSIVRGRRECRMRAAPEVPCAMCRRVRARAYRAAEAIRHSLRNGFTAYNVLSPENGSFASVAREKRTPHELDASTATSGPHVFAVRSRAVRYRHYQRPPR